MKRDLRQAHPEYKGCWEVKSSPKHPCLAQSDRLRGKGGLAILPASGLRVLRTTFSDYLQVGPL